MSPALVILTLGPALLVLAPLLALLLARARRRQAALVSAMEAAETRAQAATAQEMARAERERFVKDLALALQGQDTLEAFGDSLLTALCRRLEAKAAAFHCLDGEAGAYVLAARYAGGESPAFCERYLPGEGLGGQAVLDRQRRVCVGQAADWMWVGGATLAGVPLCLIVAPIVSGERVPGVVELALMREADAESLALLDEALPVVALSLDILVTLLRNREELERRDRRLRDSEAWLRTLYETANEGIWVIDTTTLTTDLNPAMARILGRDREAVVGHAVFEFVDETNAAILQDQMRHRQRGETGSYEIAFSRPDGRLVLCLMNASPLYDSEGTRIGSFAMVADLTGVRGMAAASLAGPRPDLAGA